MTKDNWRELTKLKVRPDQDGFVASNVRSIAEARFVSDDDDGQGQWLLYDYGIYENEAPVGFLMYAYNFMNPKYQAFIIRLMVDEKYQGKGYGRFGLQKMLEIFHAEERIRVVAISYEPENEQARQLYAKSGFRETGEIVDGEMLALLSLRE